MRILQHRKWVILLPSVVGFVTPVWEVSAVAGALGSMVLGLVVAAVLEYRDSSFYCEEDVHRTFGLPVVGTIPLLLSERELDTRRRRLTIAIAGVLLGLVVLILWRS